ncbi:MAG: 5-bromo-4-chloroindolyl phosphate hydrolysis family protein, partial [Pseudodonghicola sp.]
GARDATIKFADLYARDHDAQARADYGALLDDLEQNFAARTRKMLQNDRSDLTIEIDVLRDRLQREGVRLD